MRKLNTILQASQVRRDYDWKPYILFLGDPFTQTDITLTHVTSRSKREQAHLGPS